MYTVTVRLMSSIDLSKALAIVGIAGRYMLAVSGLENAPFELGVARHGNNPVRSSHLNNAANDAMDTMNHFSGSVYILYGF